MSIPSRQTSGLAVVSRVMGICSWTILPILGSLVAIITGHMARTEIRRRPLELEGDGLAVAGLILGWTNVVVAILAIGTLLVFFGGLAWLAHVTA